MIKDTVSFANLLAGKTYVIRGKLMDQQTGTALLDKDGKEITAATVLNITTDRVVTADNADIDARSIVINPEDGTVSGEVTLSFELDSSLLSGCTVVAFEKLYHDAAYDVTMKAEDANEKDTVVKHEEIKDKGQSVQYPGISTSAVDQDTGDHAGSIWGALINGVRRLFGDKDADGNGIPDDRQQNITDTVKLTDLVPGMTYVVSGKLYDKDASEESGENVPLTVSGKEVTQHDTITVSEDGTKIVSANGNKTSVTDNNTELGRVDGSVDLTFSLDSSLTQGKELVVFETLYHDSTYNPETDSETPKEEDKVNEHHDIHDEDQTVSDVEIHTSAFDKATSEKTGVVPSEGNPSVLVDEVHMAKLVTGMDYTVKGYLVVLNRSDLDKGKVLFLKADGTLTQDPEEAISQTLVFKAEKTEETQTLNFEITTPMVQGNSITVFEELYHNDVKIGIHPAKTEEGYDKEAIKEQTVEYPTGKTNASDPKTGAHLTEGGQDTRVITDRVYFRNLIEGKRYTIEGQLVYQEDFTDKDGVLHLAGEPLPDEGAKASVIFTAGKEIDGAEEVEETVHFDGTRTYSGYITIPFKISAKDLEGQTLVAEEIFRTEKGVPVFVHADLKDKPQFIRIPKIHTNAKAGELDEAAVYNEDGSFRTIRITDTVSYENLWTAEDVKKLHEEGLKIRTDGVIIPESPDEVFDIEDEAVYTVKGILMDKETGKPLTDATGKTYESTVTFTPETSDGTIDVTFDVNAGAFVREDGTSLEGKNVVVFEDLYYGKETKEDQHLTDHHDLEDEDQDIRFPKGRTHAKAEDTRDNETLASDHVVIHDEVSYENLHGGTEYTVTGTLQVVTEKNEAGQPVKWEAAKDDAGNVITSSTTFKTEGEYEDSVSGTVEVTFEFSGISLAGKTVVAFETCTREGQEVFTHADIKDAPQTIHIPEIKTNATVNGGKKTVAESTLQVVDRVSFTNLTIGRRYKLKGTLMNKADGKPLTVDGKEVTAEAEFIPEDPDGTVNLTFTFKADGRIGKYVAFEKLYNLETEVEGGTEVAHHEDLEDKDQTVELTRKPLIAKRVQTGDTMTWVSAAGIFTAAAAALGILLRKKRSIKAK